MRFSPAQQQQLFYEEVTARVKAYFKEIDISPYADARMWTKTTIMISLFVVPLVVISTGLTAGEPWLFFACWVVSALGMIGIGTSVMHDAQHGTYSRNKRVNRLMGAVLGLIGGSGVNWRIQHNVLHHTFTNISGLDEDIETFFLMRFSPHQKRYWHHRFQHLYVWFFYMIMTLFWMTGKDFLSVLRYHKANLLKKQGFSLGGALLQMTAVKAFYYTYILVIPILFSGFTWGQVILGFVLMHAIAGLVLSCIFQPAHIVEESTFVAPVEQDGKRVMENAWAIHEVENTSNFSPRNKLLTWWMGALNFQIEHHLFTNICHVHLPAIAPIVEETARKFGVKYNVSERYSTAFIAHVRMLRKLGMAG